MGLFLFYNLFTIAQSWQLFKGTVIDFNSNQPLSYVTISVKNKYIGTVTNAEGYFEIKVDQESNDTLVIDMLGYQKQEYGVDQLRDSAVYPLKEYNFQLAEIVVRPKSPEYYIKQSVKNIRKNSHLWAYNTHTYFKEEVKINDAFLGESESVFKSYAYSLKRHKFQLMLHRGVYDTTLDNGLFFTDQDPRDFAMGPEFIMRYANDKSIDYFLDSTYFDKYKYYFGPDTLPGYLIIEFEPKGKIEHMKMGGQIILESKTYAIAQVKFSGILKIPLVAKPVLALFGFGYRTPFFDVVKKYHKIEGKWFPSYTRLSGGMTLINKHIFKKNDVYVYAMNQILHINKIIKRPVSKISKDKLYNDQKPYEGQVYNDDQLKWSDINIIK